MFTTTSNLDTIFAFYTVQSIPDMGKTYNGPLLKCHFKCQKQLLSRHGVNMESNIYLNRSIFESPDIYNLVHAKIFFRVHFYQYIIQPLCRCNLQRPFQGAVAIFFNNGKTPLFIFLQRAVVGFAHVRSIPYRLYPFVLFTPIEELTNALAKYHMI